MRRSIFVLGGLTGAVAGGLTLWRRDPRIGTRFVNGVVDPFLVRRGLSGVGASELGTIEHVGRHSGTRHLTPVHPVVTSGGFRIVVPLGDRSEWARNVLAAGHCRLQLHDVVYELDEPVLLGAAQLPELAPPVRWLADRLGFQYLLLHRFAEHPGTLVEPSEEPEVEPEEEAEEPIPPIPATVGKA